MNRRSNIVKGMVNFPINNKDFDNTQEGGMFIRLVVEPRKDSIVCSGGLTSVLHDETYLGDDNRELDFKALSEEEQSKLNPEQLNQYLQTEQEARDRYVEYTFPNLKENNFELQYHSRPYLAVVIMGSTGWSGFSYETGEYFRCRYENLSDEGKSLYQKIKDLYPGEKLTLQTWLNT
jgi:hypothetical protein